MGIIAAGKDQFRCAVVSGHYVRGIQFLVEHLCRPEVTDFDDSLLRFKDVLRLEVSVGDAFLVDESHSLQNLLHVVSYFFNWNPMLVFLMLLDYLLQVFVAVFEN